MQHGKLVCLFFVLFVSSTLAAVLGTGDSQDSPQNQGQLGIINAQVGEIFGSHKYGDKTDGSANSPGDLFGGKGPAGILESLFSLAKLFGKRSVDSQTL